MKPHWVVLAFVALVPLSAPSEVRLPHVLSDHAVLQRSQPIHIWGWAGIKELVKVKFHDQSAQTQANEFGAWDLWLKPEAAGGPFTLEVSGSDSRESLRHTDILVGDVWFASGQSNMQMPLQGFNPQMRVKNDTAVIAAANQPQMRLLVQQRRTSVVPLADSEDSWTTCVPETARKFSAVAYFFGLELVNHEHVPIGLIDSTWGGTPAHSWISPEGIAYANLHSVYVDGGLIARQQGAASSLRINIDAQNKLLVQAGRPPLANMQIPNERGGTWLPGVLFNAMIAPYTPYQIKGVLWYQGEADTSPARAPFYDRIFPALIQDWRRQWGEGFFPFLFVQISSYGKEPLWGQVRDAQRRTLELSQTGMAVSLDVGEQNNVHPGDKQTVAHRLALAAEAIAYGKTIEYSSPAFQQAVTEGTSIRVRFTHADGLNPKEKALGDFEVAGDDHKFVPASGLIEGNAIVVSSPEVIAPRFVRYGWSGTVTHYFYNSVGLPAGSFTSEQ